ncbi:hypothetical protein CHUAL_007645 [Chamberlinius hualienensis]
MFSESTYSPMLTKSFAEMRRTVVGQRKIKICGVCGDRAKSFHFGGISCDSCKAFFRRSVQSDGFRSFRCAFQGKCDITMANRKCCQHCRFSKCLEIGMETSWVMSEEERVHLMHSRMTSRQFYNRISGTPRNKIAANNVENVSPIENLNFENTIEDLTPISTSDAFLTSNELQEVEQIVDLFNSNFDPQLNSFEVEVVRMTEFVTSIQKLVKFCRQIPRFSRLSDEAQVTLLRANVFEMFIVLHVISRSAGSNIDCYLCSFLSQKMTLQYTLRETVIDKSSLILFLMIILFSADSFHVSVDDKPQLHYCQLLDKHFRGHSMYHSNKNGSSSLAKLLLLLPTLREIRDNHMSHPLCNNC